MQQDMAANPATIEPAVERSNLTARTVARASAALTGGPGGLRTAIAFGGPALIASIAYMDPGNFATNIQAGAKYGYSLLWVVLLANIIAMLFQALSAKLGIVTGRNLAELCRDHFPRPVVLAMWVASEIAAMATDLAEFVGGAIGLSLLLHIPLLAGMTLTAVITYGLLTCQQTGFRPLELIIGASVGLICLCYLLEMFIAPIDWSAALFHTVTPQLADGEALLLAVGIIGATVMPHAIYLHSGLTQARVPVRSDDDRRVVLRYSNWEVVIALSMAGLVNMAMVMTASSAFHAGHPEVAEIETAYHTLTPLLGAAAAGIFLTSLIASGVSASTVGTLAGQNDHARLRRIPHPALAAAARHHASRIRRDRAGRPSDARPGHQPSGAEHRAAAADDLAHLFHQQKRRDGSVCERQIDTCNSSFRHGAGARAQCRPDLSEFVISAAIAPAVRRSSQR